MQKKLIAFLNAYTQGMSGGDLRFIEIIRRLKDYEISIITSSLGKKTCESRGVKAGYIITSDEEKFGNCIFTYIVRTIRAIKYLSTVKKADIIYSSSDFLPDTLPAYVYKRQCPCANWISFLHLLAPNPWFGYEGYYLKKKKMKFPSVNSIYFKVSQYIAVLLMKQRADVICVVNGEIKEYLVSRGIAKDRIKVVQNGVEADAIACIPDPKEKIYDGIFVGRFHQQKGLFDLLRIWEEVCKSNKSAKLAIVGSGGESYVKEIKNRILASGLDDNIDLLGFFDGEEKYRLLKSARVFLCPSFYESWGIVIAEALASGLPVVAYGLPIYKEIFGEGIVTVQMGDTQEFAATVEKLLKNKDEYLERKNAGLCLAKRYNWNDVAKNEIKILKDLYVTGCEK